MKKLTKDCDCEGTPKYDDGTCTLCYGSEIKVIYCDETEEYERLFKHFMKRMIEDGYVEPGYRSE